ncbi:MAG: hypothetical protein H6728_16185 [Myxococcales bacterium]|nr:hypothetical protein [Myxococcales bacterium]MCB9644613.1 hypothetical protein [Myxococcales bacterium]
MAEYVPFLQDQKEIEFYELVPSVRLHLEHGSLCKALWGLRTILRIAPMHKEALLLLDQLLAEIGQTTDGIFRLCGKKQTHIDVALHAYALGASQQYDQALFLLCELARLEPERPLLAWIWRWLPELTPHELDQEALYPPLYQASRELQEQKLSSPQLWLQLLAFTKWIYHAHPNATNWLYLRAEAAREFGDLELAKHLSQKLFQLGREAEAHLSWARTYHKEHLEDQAQEHYELALQSAELSEDTRCELVSYLIQHQRWQEAQSHLKKILVDDPYHPRALAFFFWTSYHQNASDIWPTKMASLARAYPQEKTIQHLLQQITPLTSSQASPQR